MKAIYRKIIELKYNGLTYQEISKTLGGRVSVGVIKRLFAVDGILLVPYLEYESEQNDWNNNFARSEFKRFTAFASRIQIQLLKNALKSKDNRLAFDILKDIMDRAGLVKYRPIEKNTEEPRRILTDEEFNKALLEAGINRETGLRISVQSSVLP